MAAEQAASPQAVIRISRGSRNDRVSDTLQTAYLDYQAGRHTQAAEGYRQVLTVEPANRDARLGLAALAIHRGETETARTLYRELLRRDPGDAAAHAALAGLQDETSAATESELKNLLAEQPQSAQLHFALANLYAGQVRWPLAQQAYFEAQRLAPQHPDYAFNLAVSLEHLGNPDRRWSTIDARCRLPRDGRPALILPRPNNARVPWLGTGTAMNAPDEKATAAYRRHPDRAGCAEPGSAAYCADRTEEER